MNFTENKDGACAIGVNLSCQLASCRCLSTCWRVLFAEVENLRMMDPLVFPGTIEDDEEVEVEESDSDEEEVLNFEALCFIRQVSYHVIICDKWQSTSTLI